MDKKFMIVNGDEQIAVARDARTFKRFSRQYIGSHLIPNSSKGIVGKSLTDYGATTREENLVLFGLVVDNIIPSSVETTKEAPKPEA